MAHLYTALEGQPEERLGPLTVGEEDSVTVLCFTPVSIRFQDLVGGR